MKSKPSEIITQSEGLFKPGTVLDIGIGPRAQNTIHLAESGFAVTALDIRQENLDQFPTELNITPVHSNILDFEYPGLFDNIICNFVIHFLPEAKFLKTLRDIQDHTEVGGINVISDFLNEGDFDLTNTKGHYLIHNELIDLYEDWEIIHYEEKVMETQVTNPDGSHKKQNTAHIIARKLS